MIDFQLRWAMIYLLIGVAVKATVIWAYTTFSGWREFIDYQAYESDSRVDLGWRSIINPRTLLLWPVAIAAFITVAVSTLVQRWKR